MKILPALAVCAAAEGVALFGLGYLGNRLASTRKNQ
jgi:hypothetical protein